MVFRRLRREKRPGPAPADWLVVGLGNPGAHYARHRHNIGHRVINEIARRHGVQPRPAGRMLALAVADLGGRSVALARTGTYVNESSRAVRQALAATGCDLAHLVVVYDELDLGPGALRVRLGGGHGGHNGVRDISAHLGAGFVRVRIGIGRPVVAGEPSWDPEAVAGWVLSEPEGRDREVLAEVVPLAADAVEAVIAGGVDAAAARFNRRAP